MIVLSFFDWCLQFIKNLGNFLTSLDIVSGVSILSVIIAFVFFSIVIRTLVPKA